MRRVKGSTTVEMALLMPMIFLVFLLVIRTTFYYHDKSILNGIAYETLTVAVQTARNPKPEEADVEAFCRKKAQGKLIYFSSPEVSLESTKEMAKVQITASRGKMKIRVLRQANVPYPEKKIRLKKKVESSK